MQASRFVPDHKGRKMFLYTTVLKFGEHEIPYRVSRQESHLLLFTPEYVIKDVEPPIFWVQKKQKDWQPINVPDSNLCSAVVADIHQHNID